MNINKMMAAATIAASATLPMAVNATTENITFETNGVTWRVRLEPEADSYRAGTTDKVPGTAMLGWNTAVDNIDGLRDTNLYAISNNVSGLKVDASLIPWQFDHNGTHYVVTKIALGAFNTANVNTRLTGTLNIPDSVTEIRNRAFNSQSELTGFSGARMVKYWGSGSHGGGMFANCNNMVGLMPDFSQAVLIGESLFENTSKMTGTPKFGNQLTTILFNAFYGLSFSGTIVIPASADNVGGGSGVKVAYGVFHDCTNLEAIWIKGKPTSANQTYTEVYGGTFAKNCSSLKMFLIGRNTKGTAINQSAANSIVAGSTKNVPLFVPANGQWDGLTIGGTGNKAWWYGPTNEFDLAVNDTDMTATFTPTTVNALTNALSWVSGFKTYFNLDAHISVTNTLDLTGVTIPPAMISGVTFDRLMLTATTQTQLNAILAAFPATTPISIDPTGLTENMVIPNDYPNVHVKTVPGVTIKRTARGFMLIVK